MKEVIESPDAGNCTGLKTLLDDGVNDFEIINEDRGADFSDCDCTDWGTYSRFLFCLESTCYIILGISYRCYVYMVWYVQNTMGRCDSSALSWY